MAVYYDNTPKVSLQEASPLAFCIEATQNEQKFFEAVLETDFLELYAEHGIIALEADDAENAQKETKQATGNKVAEFINNAIETIKGFFAGLWNKIKEVFDQDKKIYEKFNSVVSVDSVKEYNPSVVFASNVSGFKEYLDIVAGDMLDVINKANDEENPVFDEFKLAEFTKDAKEANDSEKETFKKAVIDFYGNSDFNNLKKSGDQFEKSQLTKINEIAKKAKGENTKENADNYKKVSDAAKVIMKFNKTYSEAVKRCIKTARSEYIKMGNFALKASKAKAPEGENKDQQAAEESAIFTGYEDQNLFEAYIDLVNESYIDEAFSLA